MLGLYIPPYLNNWYQQAARLIAGGVMTGALAAVPFSGRCDASTVGDGHRSSVDFDRCAGLCSRG